MVRLILYISGQHALLQNTRQQCHAQCANTLQLQYHL